MKKIIAGTLLASTVLATSVMPAYALEYDSVVRDYIAYAPTATVGTAGTTTGNNTGTTGTTTGNSAGTTGTTTGDTTGTGNAVDTGAVNSGNTAAGASDYNNPNTMEGAFDTYYGENNNHNTGSQGQNANYNTGSQGQNANYDTNRRNRSTLDTQSGTSINRNRQSVNGIELPNAPANYMQAGSGQFNVGNDVYIVQEGESLWIVMGNLKAKLDILYYSDPSNGAYTSEINSYNGAGSRINHNENSYNSYSGIGNEKNSLSIPVIDNNR